MIIDSHVHFWKYDKQHYSWIDKSMKMLQKDHLPEHIDLTLKRNGVDGCVVVQADPSEFDTYFLGELSETHPVIKAVVGWIDLQANNVEERIRHFSSYSHIKGYRHIVQSEPDDFLYNDSFRQGLSSLHEFGYTYDLLIYPRQLNAAIDLVKSFPDQPFVLDHCAKPRVKEKQMEDWKKGIEEIAAYPNIYCKLSGLLTEANWKDWSPGDFYPYLDIIFKSFGTDRLMFGSDWPVMLLSGIYVQWKSLLEKYMEHFIPEDKEKVFGMNAQHFYNL